MSQSTPALLLTPRLLHLRDVPLYLGMDKNRFNREARPQVVAFDRVDFDARGPTAGQRIRNECLAAVTKHLPPQQSHLASEATRLTTVS